MKVSSGLRTFKKPSSRFTCLKLLICTDLESSRPLRNSSLRSKAPTMQDGNPPSQNICGLLWRINNIASIAPNEAIEDDPKTREDLYQAAKALVASLEEPYRTIGDLCFSGTRLAALSLACDIGLFQHLTDAKRPLSLSQLAELCNAEEALVMHISRVLLAHDYIAEAGRPDAEEQAFTANPLTEHMTKTNVQAGLKLQ